ncbi:MAG: methionine gamma-lyase family protein, partial [Oscillospiraceae bacterium]|nr:methionine gamma-lyase family protein [Oscillospiraceae bacterium]
EVGYFTASIKNVRDTKVGDTITGVENPCAEPLPGYRQVQSMVYCGTSIELSADGPIREPYSVYFQGGLTWYHAKLGIMMSLQKMYEAGLVEIN